MEVQKAINLYRIEGTPSAKAMKAYEITNDGAHIDVTALDDDCYIYNAQIQKWQRFATWLVHLVPHLDHYREDILSLARIEGFRMALLGHHLKYGNDNPEETASEASRV